MAGKRMEQIIAEHELLLQAAAARGVKPISSVPGEGFGSFAEDDPATHESFHAPLEPPAARPESE